MLKLLIAEDDRESREGLRYYIPWEQYGIELCDAVESGTRALDCLRKQPVDILLTDIRMPGMDGISLAQKIRQEGMSLKIIFITAHWEMAYLKSAFSLDAIDYLLKPVKLEELDAVIRKVCLSCQAEKESLAQTLQLEAMLRQSMPAFRERLLSNLLLRRISDEANIRERLSAAEMACSYEDTYAVLSVIPDLPPSCQGVIPEERLLVTAERRLQELWPKALIYPLTLSENEWVFVLRLPRDGDEGEGQESLCWGMAMDLQKILTQLLALPVSMGVGQTVLGIASLHQSYKAAAKALEQRYFLGEGAVIHCRDIPNATALWADYRGDAAKIAQAVRLGAGLETAKLVADLLGRLVEEQSSIQRVRNVCMEVWLEISKGGDTQAPLTRALAAYWQEITEKPNLQVLSAWMTQTLCAMAEQVRQSMQRSSQSIISQIRQLLETRYAEDLTIAKMADTLYLTPNYLSLLFKKHTGQTILDCLSDIRVRKAAELLGNPQVKVYEISALVGFQTAEYFAKIFKRYTGKTPSEYREELSRPTQGGAKD